MTRCRGEAHSLSKLKDEDVIQIRIAYSKGSSLTDLSKKYKMTAPSISKIVRGTSWKHLGGPLRLDKTPNLAVGSRCPLAKLTERDILPIKLLRQQGYTYTAISKIFKVHKGTISRICQGLTWKHCINDVKEALLKSNCI